MNFWSRAGKPKKHRVYADAAAATPLSKRAKDEMLRLLDTYGNAGGLHTEAVEAKEAMEDARKMVAKAIGAHADEIVFTASGTEGNNLAIAGTIRPLLLEHGPLHAITCAVEHQSVLEPLRALEKEGLQLTVLPVDKEGLVSPKELAAAITDKTIFVSIQLINSEVGTIEPIQEIAKEIRKARQLRKTLLGSPSEALTPQNFSELPLYFHSDASQALLWMDVKVEKLGIDMLTLDAQKVLGPKGVGALFVKRRSHLDPQMRGGTQEHGLRGGTPNPPVVGSFAVALEDAQNNINERVAYMESVRDYCFSEMQKLLPTILMNGPEYKNRAANNVNVSVPGLDAQMAVIALNAEGVAASTRSACNIGEEEPSHVIQALGTPKELAGTAIRLTLLPSATKADALFIAQALAKVTRSYRQS